MANRLDDDFWTSLTPSLDIPKRKTLEALTPGEKSALLEFSRNSATRIHDLISNAKLRQVVLRVFYTTPQELRGEETYYIGIVNLAKMMISTIGRFENEHPALKSPSEWRGLKRAVRGLRDMCNDILRHMGALLETPSTRTA